jgi:hypothetical protein
VARLEGELASANEEARRLRAALQVSREAERAAKEANEVMRKRMEETEQLVAAAEAERDELRAALEATREESAGHRKEAARLAKEVEVLEAEAAARAAEVKEVGFSAEEKEACERALSQALLSVNYFKDKNMTLEEQILQVVNTCKAAVEDKDKAVRKLEELGETLKALEQAGKSERAKLVAYALESLRSLKTHLMKTLGGKVRRPKEEEEDPLVCIRPVELGRRRRKVGFGAGYGVRDAASREAAAGGSVDGSVDGGAGGGAGGDAGGDAGGAGGCGCRGGGDGLGSTPTLIAYRAVRDTGLPSKETDLKPSTSLPVISHRGRGMSLLKDPTGGIPSPSNVEQVLAARRGYVAVSRFTEEAADDDPTGSPAERRARRGGPTDAVDGLGAMPEGKVARGPREAGSRTRTSPEKAATAKWAREALRKLHGDPHAHAAAVRGAQASLLNL